MLCINVMGHVFLGIFWIFFLKFGMVANFIFNICIIIHFYVSNDLDFFRIRNKKKNRIIFYCTQYKIIGPTEVKICFFVNLLKLSICYLAYIGMHLLPSNFIDQSR